MDKLAKRIREIEEEHAEEFLQEHIAQHDQAARDRALMIAGGFRTALKISAAINSEVMRALELFQEERLYTSFGYERFAEFLDQSEFSPMTKAQYYERKAILDKEGDMLFDLLSDLGMSIRKRKLLGKGNVEVHGEKVIVRDGEEQTEIEVNDRSRLLETLSALADANADKSAKLAKQKEKIDRHGAEKKELYDEIDRERARKAAEVSGDPHSMALAALVGAFKNLRDEVENLSAIDRGARKDHVLELLAGQMQLTAEGYGSADWARHAPRPERAPTGDEEGDYVEDLLDRVFDGEVVDLDENQRELAAAMS